VKATGSLASITSDAPLALTRALIAFSRTVARVPGGAAALTSAPAARNGENQGKAR